MHVSQWKLVLQRSMMDLAASRQKIARRIWAAHRPGGSAAFTITVSKGSILAIQGDRKSLFLVNMVEGHLGLVVKALGEENLMNIQARGAE